MVRDMTELESLLFTVALVTGFLTMNLYVIFGQVTVKKLRKNKDTKYALGIEFASGWDILNVAKTFALPKRVTKKWKNSRQSAFYANVDLLYQNTSKFDRALGAVFYWIYAFTGLSFILLVLLEWLRHV